MKFKILFFLTLIFFVIIAINKYSSVSVPFAYDEPDYVANSMLFSEFNFGINTNPLVWSQRWAYDQPHFYHFLCALFLELKYKQPINTTLNQNQLGPNQRYSYGNPNIVFSKIGDGKILSDPEITNYQKAFNTILTARELSFYFYLLSGIILISIIYFFCHPILAVPISIIYLNTYFFSTSILAQADGLLILLILINTLLSLIYIKLPEHRLIITILLGISCGLALSTKLNGGITLINPLLCILIVFFSKPKPNTIISLLHLTLITLMTVLVFVWLNPYLYPNPTQKTYEMFRYRIELTSNSKSFFPSNEILPAKPINKSITILKNLYYQTGQTPTFSLILSSLSSILSLSYLFLIFTEKISFKPTTLYLLVSTTCSFFLILFYIPMNWYRYYYPALIENILMIATVLNLVFFSKAHRKTN